MHILGVMVSSRDKCIICVHVYLYNLVCIASEQCVLLDIMCIFGSMTVCISWV